MACSAYISYRLGPESEASAKIQVTSRPRIKVNAAGPATTERKTSTAFVLVDPSSTKSNGSGVDVRTRIRKHASKACAAQRLATIAAKRQTRNAPTKRERQRQQAAERLEAALQHHAQKLGTSNTIDPSVVELLEPQPQPQPQSQPQPKRVDSANASEASFRKNSTSSSEASFRRKSSHDSDTAASVATAATTASGDIAFDRKRCSISWILTPSSHDTYAQHRGLEYDDSEPADEAASTSLVGLPSTSTSLIGMHSASTSVVEMHSKRLDPFSTFPVDVQDDGSLNMLCGFLSSSIFPLMDLRLPTKFDRVANTRHTHSQMLPHFVLSSEPLFWTMALCAATIFTMRDRKRPGAEPVTMGYRYMAIRSVNQQLASLGQNNYFDIGLLYAIASLGVWEREKGSKEVWQSHCHGIEMLSQKLRKARQHHLLTYIVASCHTPGSVPIEYHIGEGFKRATENNGLNEGLIAGIYECGMLDTTPPSAQKSEMIQKTEQQLLGWRPSDAVPKTLCGNQERGLDGDRMNLELHVLLQGAGASLLGAVGRECLMPYVDAIDIDEMCREAVGLAKSVAGELAYNELLLWCIMTIFALNNYTDPAALDVVAMVARRLDMNEWTPVEISLRLFVYLDSVDAMYRDYWTTVQQHSHRRSSEV